MKLLLVFYIVSLSLFCLVAAYVKDSKQPTGRSSTHLFIKKKAFIDEHYDKAIVNGSKFHSLHYYEESLRINEDRSINLSGWELIRIESKESCSMYYYVKTNKLKQTK